MRTSLLCTYNLYRRYKILSARATPAKTLHSRKTALRTETLEPHCSAMKPPNKDTTTEPGVLIKQASTQWETNARLQVRTTIPPTFSASRRCGMSPGSLQSCVAVRDMHAALCEIRQAHRMHCHPFSCGCLSFADSKGNLDLGSFLHGEWFTWLD